MAANMKERKKKIMEGVKKEKEEKGWNDHHSLQRCVNVRRKRERESQSVRLRERERETERKLGGE